MKPPPISKQLSLHSVALSTFLDPLHELVLLALLTDWKALEAKFGARFKPGKGRPPIAMRVMIALNLLKYLYDESDESVVARVRENPYWQHFCGFAEFQRAAPCDASSLTRWRRKLGGDLDQVLRESGGAGAPLSTGSETSDRSGSCRMPGSLRRPPCCARIVISHAARGQVFPPRIAPA